MLGAGKECIVPIELVYNYWMVAKPAAGKELKCSITTCRMFP